MLFYFLNIYFDHMTKIIVIIIILQFLFLCILAYFTSTILEKNLQTLKIDFDFDLIAWFIYFL